MILYAAAFLCPKTHSQEKLRLISLATLCSLIPPLGVEGRFGEATVWLGTWRLTCGLIFCSLLVFPAGGCGGQDVPCETVEQEDKDFLGWRSLHPHRQKTFSWTQTLCWLTLHWCSFVIGRTWKYLKGWLDIESASLHSSWLRQ